MPFWCYVSFKADVSLLIFCLKDLSIDLSEVLKFLIIVSLPISTYRLLIFAFYIQVLLYWVHKYLKMLKMSHWVTQSVKGLTSAQVMTSRFMGLSPVLGSVLTAQNLQPASDSVSPSLCPSLARTLSLSKINTKKKR